MAVVYSQNIVEIAIQATLAGRPHVNVLHVWNDEAGGNDESKVRDVLDNWQDHIHTFLSNQYVLIGADWRSLDPDDNNVGTMARNAAKSNGGASTGEAAPPNVAFLIHKRTANRPRGRRDGRMYVGGVPEANVSATGAIASASLTFAQNAVNAFLSGVNDTADPIGGSSYLAVLETTPASRAPGTNPVTIGSRKVNALAVDQLVGTQRDRLR